MQSLQSLKSSSNIDQDNAECKEIHISIFFTAAIFYLVHQKVGIPSIDDIGDINDFDICDDNNLNCDLCEYGNDYDNWQFITVVNWPNC